MLKPIALLILLSSFAGNIVAKETTFAAAALSLSEQPLPAPVFKAVDGYWNLNLPALHEIVLSESTFEVELFQAMRVESESHQSGILNSIRATPGRGFAASLLVPGLSQVANQQYIKAGIMAAVEVAAIYFIVDGTRRGQRLENEYQQFGDANWSLIKYTAWVHDYYMNVPGGRNPDAPALLPSDLLTNAGRSAANPLTGFPDPAYDTNLEWSWVDRTALNTMERRSRYSRGTNFTHEVNPFGSQQYYELMSKYWQFGPGWRDWNDSIHSINMASNDFMSPMWLQHAAMEERFNSAYQLANNMVSALLLNHLVSAFDAYFIIKMRQHRLETTARADQMGNHLQLTWRF
jgi:hypothetical protein